MAKKGVVAASLLIVGAVVLARVVEGENSSSVLLITVDTLRADRVGRGLTPNIDALGQQGISFTNAVTPVPLTLPAHASLLTGIYPMYHQVRDFTGAVLDDRFASLAELYRGAGYRTAAFVSAFVLDSMWGLEQGFETYHDRFEKELMKEVQPGTIERRADETIDGVLKWLKQNGGSRFFLWVHLFDPHSAYAPPEPFRTRFASRPYDGEVAFVDAHLGRLFAYLREARLYDRLVIVFTSDHGESLGEHGEAEHGFFVYDATIKVPLIFKLPGRPRPLKLAHPISLVDVAPTLLQISRLNRPAEMQGRGVYALMTGKGRKDSQGTYSETLYPLRSFGWHDLKAYRTSRYKYIETKRPELYDLEADPGETKNLMDAHGALARQLSLQLRMLYERFEGRFSTAAPGLDPEVLSKLRSLGYLAYGTSRKSSASESNATRADPKDKIEVFNRILQAMDLAQGRRWGESSRLLEQILRSESALAVAHNLLGQNHLREGKVDVAIHEFKQTLQARPDWEEAAFNLARAHSEKGDVEAARAGFEFVLRLNPRNFMARFNLGSLWMSKSLETALDHFQQAQLLQPDFPPLQRNLGVVLADLKRFPEGEPVLRKAIELAPADAIAHNYLGIVLRNTGRVEMAIEQYQKALEIDPQYAVARLNLAFAYHELKDVEKARREFEALCRTRPDLCEQYRRFFRE